MVLKKLLHPLCCFKERPRALLLLAALLLLVLYLLRQWLEFLLIIYLVILVLLGLIGLIRLLQGFLRRWCCKGVAAPKGTGSEGHPPSRDVHVPPHTYKRPDPTIYSQYYLMSQGLAVTWDNPDIQLYDGATPVSSHALIPGKAYTIRARIWNGSVDAPAVNVLVRFSYLSFGAGTVKQHIGQKLVDVPVKGAAGLPALAEHLWTTPSTPGHYCIQVELVWPDDANPNNNLGQENVDVKPLNSPRATFTFTLRNDSAFRRRLLLQADAYRVPPRDPCAEHQPAGGDPARRQERDPYARHRPGANPLPAGWQIAYRPGSAVELGPGEEQLITVDVTAPDGFVGRQAINVNALDGATLVGGVTFYAHS
jgi:hypothetical protein